MKKLHVLMLIVGLAFVGYLVHRIGPAELWRELTNLGWGLLPLVCCEGIAEFFHTISWRYCLSGPHRSIPLMRLFRINMAGYAISYLTPTASVGGDVTKAGLLALSHKGPEAVSAVLVGKLSFAIAHLFFVVLGSILILPHIDLRPAIRVGLLSASLLVAAGIVAFLWIQKHGKLGAFVRWLVARNIGGKRLRNLAHQINSVDETLKVYFRERPWGLPLAVFWHLIGYAVGIFQTWFFLRLLVDDSPIPRSIVAWFLGMWFDLLSFAVPTNVGVFEGTRTVAFSVVAYAPLFGMTYAVALRAAQLFWAAFGLITYASLISTRTQHPRTEVPLEQRWQRGVPHP